MLHNQPMPMKAAAKRPAASSQISVVKRYMARAVNMLKRGARNTQMSLMSIGRVST